MSTSFDKVVEDITLLGKPSEKMDKYNEEHGLEKKKYLVIEELLVDALVRLDPEKYRTLNIRENDVRGVYLHEIMNVLTTALQCIHDSKIVYGLEVNNHLSLNKNSRISNRILLITYAPYFK